MSITEHQEALNKAAKNLSLSQQAAGKALGARECAQLRAKDDPAPSNYRVLADACDREVNERLREVAALRQMAAKARAAVFATA